MSMEYPGREPVVHVEGMASRRKRLSDEFKSLVEDQQKLFDERIKKQEKHFNERFEKQEKRLEDQQNEIKELKADLRSSRSEARKLSYCRMLNAYLNIVKFAKEDEPVAKKRRNSKQFQTHSARLFSGILEAHKGKGDELDANEIRFLDVFSRIDELCAVGVGNLRFE